MDSYFDAIYYHCISPSYFIWMMATILCFACSVYYKVYYKYKELFWQNIGSLTEICMYDFYSGVPRQHRTASTTLESVRSSLINDRKFFVYTGSSATQKRNKIVLDKREFFSLTPQNIFVERNVNAWMFKKRTTAYFPDGSYMFMYDCGDEFAEYLKFAYGAGQINYRLGMQTNYDKALSRDHYRHRTTNTRISKSLNPRHAECLLVNQNSIDDIKNQIPEENPDNDILRYNFRPHLVVEIPKYMEDKIKTLRIGTAIFSNPLPCVVDQKVNFNSVSKIMSTCREPYVTLERTRKIKDVCPTISRYSWLTVFGTHFIVSREGEFKITDRVFVKF